MSVRYTVALRDISLCHDFSFRPYVVSPLGILEVRYNMQEPIRQITQHTRQITQHSFPEDRSTMSVMSWESV